MPPSRSFREQYYMQESSTFRPVPDAAGRLFGSGAAAAVAAPEGQEVRCPRCDSANTKFCYYNNYNLAQPRHFCRGCRRYWTKGGLLRNVPVGGGCRKPKRGQVAASSSSDVVDRNAKNARSGCTGPGSCTSPDAPTTSKTVGASSAAARSSSGGCPTATGAGVGTAFATDAPPLPLPPPRLRPMFADQEAAFASFFMSPSPPPLPAISLSPQPKSEDAVALAPALTLAEQPSSSASCTPDMAPLSARSGGAAMITSAAADWPPETATVIDAGMFDLAGNTSSYWNAASWTTDPDGTMYLP